MTDLGNCFVTDCDSPAVVKINGTSACRAHLDKAMQEVGTFVKAIQEMARGG